jgi:2-C-methyl-D-erythritol 4-phosphate cytidylyltransferase
LLRSASNDWVILADAARPFISLDLYNAVYKAAKEHGAAGAFLTPDVPIAELSGGKLMRTLKRNEVGLFQLPHGFSRQLLLNVYTQAENEGWEEQSTLELVLRAGHDVAVVQGEKNNIKLTSEEDWRHAQLLTEHLA